MTGKYTDAGGRWPDIRVLYFLPDTPGQAPRLVDAGPHVHMPSVEHASMQRAGAHYMSCELRAGLALRSLPDKGLRVGMSPLGDLRIWHQGKICAAQSLVDCRQDGGWLLSPDDIAYLDAYLAVTGDTMRDPI